MATEPAAPINERARHLAALAGAVALHVVVVAVAAAVYRAPAPAAAPPEPSLADIELSVTGVAAPDGAPAAPRGDGSTTALAASPPSAGARAEEGGPRAVPLQPSDPSGRPPPEGSTEPPIPPPSDPATAPLAPTAPAPVSSAPAPVPGAPTSEYGAAPPPMPILTGPLSLGAPLWTVPGALPGPTAAAPAPTTIPKAAGPAPDIATRVVKDVLTERDRWLGVGTPGATTVSNALAAAVRASSAPSDCVATFVVSLGPDGSVATVRVDSFRGGDTTLWNGLAKGVAGQLAGQKLTIAGNTHGAVVRVSLSSGVLPVSGKSEGLAGIKPTGPPKDDPVHAGVPRTHKPFADDCTAAKGQGLPTICMPGGLGGSFDVAGALAGSHRVVKTSFSVALMKPPAPVAATASATPPGPRP